MVRRWGSTMSQELIERCAVARAAKHKQIAERRADHGLSAKGKVETANEFRTRVLAWVSGWYPPKR
ncbi:hypothetical protein NOVOSPHI9U_710004 [Novosphingobium sp. 9U]|nr:hypothetical protein NOVOSPHI9U_710004 [Novosphingobium sp. 9U]